MNMGYFGLGGLYNGEINFLVIGLINHMFKKDICINI